ncbi:2-oxoacid:acceptor oxidoreductase family protein [uncultured Lutibacter sp.]|uniref:2-oxoacid:acceptor oxidoreductase family protein n=1 Tax=uncultured Lutibacter sp. TaxID=437739 RepID=UPI00260F5F53|nr:2-oxoacid:acceptor oxidoreductase family protein [uncultured Lutibacter sp.]
MTEEIIIAGFGGQGVLSMGKILAYSGIMQDQEVSWMPSYGPEMRGGTANVTVILSDERISSPYLQLFDTAIILNQQSMDKFEKSVKPGGLLLYEPNGIHKHPTRTDINIYQIEGNKISTEMGNKKIFNMVVLGAYLKLKPIVNLKNVIEGLKKSLPERYHHLIPLNEEAITKGMEATKAYISKKHEYSN